MTTILFDPSDPADVARAFVEIVGHADQAIQGLQRDVASLQKDVVSLAEIIKTMAGAEDIAVLDNLQLAGIRATTLRRVAEWRQEQLIAAGLGPANVLEQLAREDEPASSAGPKLKVVGGTDIDPAGKPA